MKNIITDFISALFTIIIFFVALIIVLAAIPLYLIAFPFVILFTFLFGDDSNDYN